MKKNKKIIQTATSALGKTDNIAVNKVMKTLAQKQFFGLVVDNFELQTAQINVIVDMVRLFSNNDEEKVNWAIDDLKKSAEKYKEAKRKYLVDLFGQEKYDSIWGMS